jgi:hypothetical protein
MDGSNPKISPENHKAITIYISVSRKISIQEQSNKRREKLQNNADTIKWQRQQWRRWHWSWNENQAILVKSNSRTPQKLPSHSIIQTTTFEMVWKLQNEEYHRQFIYSNFSFCWNLNYEKCSHRERLCERFFLCFFLVQAINTHKKHGGEHASLKNKNKWHVIELKNLKYGLTVQRVKNSKKCQGGAPKLKFWVKKQWIEDHDWVEWWMETTSKSALPPEPQSWWNSDVSVW